MLYALAITMIDGEGNVSSIGYTTALAIAAFDLLLRSVWAFGLLVVRFFF